MNERLVALAVAAIGVVALSACSSNVLSNEQSVHSLFVASLPGQTAFDLPPNVRRACPEVEAGQVRCFALIRTDVPASLGVHRGVAPSGYSPDDLASAYGLPRGPKSGAGQVFAVVDAFDDPNAESDLKVYRAQFNLKPCTTANGCFEKVDEHGGKNYPLPNGEWANEMSVDLDMASAACPNCKLILVEASPPRKTGDLAVAENEAVKLGADVVSNSYGGYPETVSHNPAYDHPGHMIVAASGDGGYRYPFQPCSFASVVCVGGTSLYRAAGGLRGRWFETSWYGAGSGCSVLVAKPEWQTDSGCTMRSWTDVSADANPKTGVAFYDTYQSPGWQVSGGTSVGTPLVAGAYALAKNAKSQHYAQGLWRAGGSAHFNDVISGIVNGTCPPQIHYICAPGPGYDGVTGWGTPNGIGAF